MADTHHFISELLKGNIFSLEPQFELDENFRAIDRELYQGYIPDLCRLIVTEKRPFNFAIAIMTLQYIVSDSPDHETADCLLRGLNIEDQFSRESLLELLAEIKLPKGIDLEPLKQRVRKGNIEERDYAIKAFAAVGEDGEPFLLEVLRRTDSWTEVQALAGVLGDYGTIFSIPVLMARLETKDADTNDSVYRALQGIASRLQIPQEIKERISEPDFWKVKWEGSKESFIGFVDFISILSGNHNNPDATDQLAEIFIEEMGVDISPYHTFKELRLCSSSQDLLDMLETMKNSLQSDALLELALSGTGITESKETQMEDIYSEMMNDYFVTRLRRRIKFEEDDY